MSTAIVGPLLGLALGCGLLVSQALAGSTSSGPVSSLSDGTTVGTAQVTQTDSKVSFNLRTSQLEPGHAYTVWVMVFNHPEHCGDPVREGLRCGFGDVFAEETGFSAAYGGGHVVNTSGRTGFGGSWRAGDDPGIIMGEGLTNPAGAEVHLRIRDHGPARPGYVPAQIHTFNGGCEPGEPNEGQCEDVQTSGL